ncbi:A-kinase anchor protein 9 isoform X4 [Sitodiplosis mosellana]|uniref:A-kinase anchor protein 9 isoform X4 n=1 Tax=Sitodiplosis mosellana TaxID=263140 RepID=UPI0024449008|nr:A-kinase anchor protein 9 isoform X4 [Sitodiplosis mosellana]
MDNLTPLTSQSPSKENDSIDEGSAQRRAVKSRDEDDFEDSLNLNVSISEHISEDIESTSAVEDSIEKSAQRFDQLLADKKRKLFDFDESDKSNGVDSDGVRKFSKFDVENLLDESLSGDNIAKHFMADVETSTQRNSKVNERIASVSQQRTKSDELKIADVDEGAAANPSQPTTATTATNVAIHIDDMQKSKDKSNLVELVHLSDSHKSDSDSRKSDTGKNDVILINDHEISIHSLKELQEQRSRSDIEPNNAPQTNQNTTSDISSCFEDNAKEQRSIEDISGISINESSAKVESEEIEAERSNTSSSERVSRSKSEIQTEKNEESPKSDEDIKKCKPMDEDSLPELSVIEEVSAADELSSRQNIIESIADKKSEMEKIFVEAVNRLPLDKENRPPNLNDDLLSVGSKHLTSSQNSTLTEGTVYNALTKIDSNLTAATFADELHLNLVHMQNKIKELQNINGGKYSASFFDLPMISSSRRNSLIQEFPQSGRDSSSITTNSTEYRPFQDEYFRLTDFQVALIERDKIIQELTDSLKQSIEIRDQLNERNVALANEAKELKAATDRRKWITDRDTFNEPRLSETTIDLVGESDFEDDEFYKKILKIDDHKEPAQEIDSKPDELHKTKELEAVRNSNPTIDDFKKSLNEEETELFTRIESQFEQMLNEKINDVKEKLQQEQLEKAELDSETNRLRQLLSNIKSGSTEVIELRAELDKIHKKEMENLRMYFERKCTDLEKQYSEDVFSQHSRRHSNDTNSDLSDDEIFLPDETKAGVVRRTSKTGDILASPTHRKITPTHIRSTGSSPIKKLRKGSQSEFRSLDNSKLVNLNAEEIHEHYRNVIADLKQTHDENVKQLKYKLQSFEGPQADDEYLTLLAEPISDESRWPPELILLREKFTAKSQLEIAQLQIKHEEEMSRLKNDHQKQLDRKLKRNTDFDNSRGLEKCESERDSLRELCNTFRHLLYELAKCVSVCENDLNASLVDELNKYGILQPSLMSPSKTRSESPTNENDLNQSMCSSIGNRSMRLSLVPDVSGILSLIEDPSLLNFVTEKGDNEDSFSSSVSKKFDLNECLEKLKHEADSLLHLSEKMIQKRNADNRELDKTQKSLEEEDGLKIAKDDFNVESSQQKPRFSLPAIFPSDKHERKTLSHSDLNDLKNRLLLSESRNQELEKKLAESQAQQRELTQKLNSYVDSQSEELSEGYGISQLRSPQRHPANKAATSFTALQERAKQYFNDTNTSDVSQLLEDFCRECDRHVEEEKDKMKDLQEQSDILRQQVQELEVTLNASKKKNTTLETDLKESIEKIYELREIIVDLETRIKEKDNEVESLESEIDRKNRTNESLQTEMKSLLSQSEIAPAYQERIQQLEEQLESLQPNADQSIAIERIASHLREIEDNLDRKINLLESVHVGTGTVTTCSSPSEDVSVRGSGHNLDAAISPRYFKYLAKDPSFPVDQIMRIIEKMQKHSRVEEAAIKLVRDLEMQIKALHTSYMELQNERDLLREKMDEQLMRITTIQSRLDEQRQRAEELQRAGTSDLNLKVYDLQAEVNALKETVSSRDKQIGVLKSHLAQSKEIIDRQEAEIASYNCVTDGNDTYSKVFVEKLEARIASKDLENKSLREKIRTEMITKVALPDLMETVLADKTDEIDYLKEQLVSKEKELESKGKELKHLRDSQIFAKAEEKLSEYFTKNHGSDYFDNDYIRKMSESGTRSSLPIIQSSIFGNNENTPPLKPRQIYFTSKSTNDTNLMQTPLLLDQFSSVVRNDSLADNDDSSTQLREEIEYLKLSLEDKTKLVDDVTAESKKLKEEFDSEKVKLATEIDRLRGQIDELQLKVETIEAELVVSTKNYDKKCTELAAMSGQLNEEHANHGVIKHQLNSMGNTIKHKDELISKLQKDIENYNEIEKVNLDMINRLKRENFDLTKMKSVKDETDGSEAILRQELEMVKDMLQDTEQELSEKMIAYEKCLLDLKEQEKKIFHLTDIVTDSKSARSVEEMRIEMRIQQEENERLKKEIEELKNKRIVERSTSPIKSINIDELTSKVEEELNYSRHLDNSILKAIDEKDEIVSNEENEDELDALRAEKEELIKAIEKLQESLECEREKFSYIHQQDAKCIDVMSKRLEAAIDTENDLNKLLEEERSKTSKLSTKMLEHQFERAKLSSSNMSLNESPIASPRRLTKGGESDQELLKCQNDEIKLLKSQLEREKERAVDVEKSLGREKNRFEKELSEQKAYGERMKDELERIIRENKTLQEELDDAQEKVTLSTHDIENMQARIKQLQDAETHQSARSEKDRNELTQSIATCRELKNKLINLERERDVLQERVSILQADIDRGAQREARLTESLVAGYQQSNVLTGGIIPQQLLAKLKEMNDNLSENVRENRQLSETLQMLTEERHVLQKKVHDLEIICVDRDELEERANHLFSKYLRTESFRRALIHQKRYLMIVLSTYESNETKVLAALNGNAPVQRQRKVPSFKSVVLVAIAIERMKFIHRRWQTGKRVCAKNPIFPHNTPLRRNHSASTINWTRNGHDTQIPNQLHHPQSPPMRERPMTSVLKGRRCTNNDFTTTQI